MNRLVLTGELVERGALRYTPAGLPALDLSLKHESEVTQDGKSRKVWFEIKARALGDITQRVARLEMEAATALPAFWARSATVAASSFMSPSSTEHPAHSLNTVRKTHVPLPSCKDLTQR